MSVMLQCYSVIIDRGISEPGQGKDVVYGLNAIKKNYRYQLMSNFQLPAPKYFFTDSNALFHTKNASLA